MRIILAAVLALAASACMQRPWVEYSYPAWGFTAWYPSPPTTREITTAQGGQSVRGFVVEGGEQDKDLTIQVSDLTGVDRPTDALMSEAIHAAGGGKPVTMTYWALGARGQHMGRAGFIDEGGGMKREVHVLVAYGRLYQVSARWLGPSSPKAKQFLESFQLIEPPGA